MTAQEMFKEVGFNQYYDTLEELVYKNIYDFEVVFRKQSETVAFYVIVDGEYVSCSLRVRTHLAIHQQMKELGWLDEE